MPIAQGERARFIGPHEMAEYNQLCSFYNVTLELGADAGEVRKATALLRPEPFVVTRITWATTGDTLLGSNAANAFAGISIMGRTVRVAFGDTFTNFMGQRNGLISAVFGDSNGFLNLPKGIVFGGSQNLEIELQRLFFPGNVPGLTNPPASRFDFTFAGVSLLPKFLNQSGSE